MAVSKAVEIATRGAALVEADAKSAADALAGTRAAQISPQSAQNRSLDLEGLVEAHEARVTRLAYRLLGWRGGEVEDVVQDVFLAALRHLHRFRGDASVATWLTAITINRCRTAHRRRRLRRLLVWKSVDVASPDEPAAWARPAADETAERVRQAIRELPPRDREVIVLRYFEQLSGAEIAVATGQSVGAVDVRLHRARGRLATALGGLFEEDHT